MFEKVFGYILSLRKRKRMRKLELIHKMSDSEPIDKALAYCSFYAQLPKAEPTIKERMSTRVATLVPNILALEEELKRIAQLVQEEDKRFKYYETLPVWGANSAPKTILLDELLQKSAYTYYDLNSAIAAIGESLRSIKNGVKQPHNEKMETYYLKKPGVVYREAVNILRQIV